MERVLIAVLRKGERKLVVRFLKSMSSLACLEKVFPDRSLKLRRILRASGKIFVMYGVLPNDKHLSLQQTGLDFRCL